MQLFEHNRIAYDAAVTMIAETGKAAVIHPTGTGKSFIGFKLCSDIPQKTVCWLSPSEYIFKTQLENWYSAGGETLENIRFFTYAKLIHMDDYEVVSINPDYIVLDEFHRCGAEVWGRSVDRLLELHKEKPVLGLTATNIRYLDDCRNMTDELFDGNIASEITLGEAIVRGILSPPKYVISLFSYHNGLEKYEEKIRKAKSKAVRDAAEEYLEALKRTLEKADGLDVLFTKHIAKKNSKFIVFCSDYEHMKRMLGLAPKWFDKIDLEPRFYSVYSNDPETSSEFKAFKEDNSEHLKLLFCIDMLNEGVHIDDVDGVILLRPTVSPIIYKQQIGRALSVGKKKNAIIFDIVMNIENLYSISSLQEEVNEALAFFRYLGEKDVVVNEQFQVVDEVRDCRNLFNKLNDALASSWNLMYSHAKNYFEENGHLDIPRRYKTTDGYSLGTWLVSQRRIRKGLAPGILTDHQIEKLDSIAMRWESYSDISWERYFDEAKKYFECHGDLEVEKRYISKTGVKLGAWLSNLRNWNNIGVHSCFLTPERKIQLESIGMVWNTRDYFWDKYFAEASQFYADNLHLEVPKNYITPSGMRLGTWISRMRGIYRGTSEGILTAEQITRLESIGMVWDSRRDLQWSEMYSEAREYFYHNKNLNVPQTYVCKSGKQLGRWIVRQRKAFEGGTLSREKIAMLNELQMIWKKPDSWMVRYEVVKKYLDEHGGNSISQAVVVNGIWIGKWLGEQRKKKEKLSPEQIRLLEGIGVQW